MIDSKKIDSLLTEISNGEKDITVLLGDAAIIANLVDDDELKSFSEKELSGYRENAPKHRILKGVLIEQNGQYNSREMTDYVFWESIELAVKFSKKSFQDHITPAWGLGVRVSGAEFIRLINDVKNILRKKLIEIKSNYEKNENKIEKERLSKTIENQEITNNKKIFIVHGHDGEMKEAVARFISKMGYNPIILHEQPNNGKTIIQKFEDNSDVGYAIVLLSPDDKGKENNRTNKYKLRARQNVILELGYFIGKLSRKRVLALMKDEKDFETPSDIVGVLYEKFDSGGSWKMTLLRELKSLGFDVDFNVLDR